MDAIEKTIEELGGIRRTCWAVSILHVCLYAGALILFFLGRPWQVALSLLAGNVLLYLLVVRRFMGRYRQGVTQASVRFGLGDGLGEFAFRDKGGMSRGEYAALGLTPILEGEQSLMCRNTFSGQLGLLPLTGREATLHYEAPGGKRDYRFLSGTLLTAGELGTGGWLLLRDGLIEAGALEAFLAQTGYRPCPEAPAEGFALYALGDCGPLDPEEAHKVASACKKVKGLSALRLTQTGAAAFLNGCFYTGTRYPSAQITAERLRVNPLPQRDELWKFFRLWIK